VKNVLEVSSQMFAFLFQGERPFLPPLGPDN